MVVAGKCSTVKVLLFIVNFLVLLSGGAVLAVGLLVTESFKDYPVLLEDTLYSSAPVAIIVVGTVAIIVAMSGFCASVSDNRLVLLVYGVMMTFVFIAEVVVGIMALINVDGAEERVAIDLDDAFHHQILLANMSIKVIDDVQLQFECCGVESAKDYYTESGNFSLPQSCCNQTSADVIFNGCHHGTAWNAGCKQKFSDYVEYNVYLVGAVTLGAAALVLIAIFLTFLRIKYHQRIDASSLYLNF